MAGREEEAIQTGSGLHWTTLCIKLFVLSLPISIIFPRITDFSFFLSLCWCIAGEAGLAGELAQVGDDFRFSNWISCCQWRACRAGQMPVDCIWVRSFKLQRFTDSHSLPWCVKAFLRIGKLEEKHRVTSSRKCRWKIWKVTTVMMFGWSIWGDVDFIIYAANLTLSLPMMKFSPILYSCKTGGCSFRIAFLAPSFFCDSAI